VLQKKNSAAPLLARLSPQRGEVIDLVCFHGQSVTEVAEIVGIAEAGVRWHGGRYGRPYRAGRSMAEPMEGD
jgi:DNA-directed RNA polymerase specialized sigma24 family protein